jgi:hypothetical protein
MEPERAAGAVGQRLWRLVRRLSGVVAPASDSPRRSYLKAQRGQFSRVCGSCRTLCGLWREVSDATSQVGPLKVDLSWFGLGYSTVAFA